jgi:hypothetical protein
MKNRNRRKYMEPEDGNENRNYENDLVSIGVAALLLEISEELVEDAIDAGQIPIQTHDGKPLIRIADLEKWERKSEEHLIQLWLNDLVSDGFMEVNEFGKYEITKKGAEHFEGQKLCERHEKVPPGRRES